MKQHGFARQRAWSVVARSPNEVTLELASDDATRGQFPWDFLVRIHYALVGTTLSVETRVENTERAGAGTGTGTGTGGGTAMPFALGFHPYFYVPDGEKARARIPTGATRAFDNVTKSTVDLKGPIDLTVKEVDLHLFDHDAHSAVLERATDRVTVTADPEFARWVIWSLAGKDFVCLEPWTAGANALNSGEGLLDLAPGESKTLTMAITVAKR
jgi:galactose mutarotase-like enzyme